MAVVLNASGVNRVRFTVINNMKSLFHPQREIHYIGGTDILPPPLEPEEEAYVLSQLDTKRSEEAKALLIERNLRLVVYIAKKFENTGIGVEDLISIGTIGLIKAIHTFKLDKKIKLATYASRCIENEILMYLRRTNKTKLEVSIDEPLNVDWDGNELLLSDILGTDNDVISKDIEDEIDRKMLNKAMEILSEREKLIIRLRFGIGGDGNEEKTQNAYKQVFTDADHFTDYADFDADAAQALLDENGYSDEIETVVAAQDASENTLGYVFTVTAKDGSQGSITFSVGIQNDGTVNGYSITSISETPGLGMKAQDEEFYSQFQNKKVDSFTVVKSAPSADNEIEAISGSTITSKAMANGVNACLTYFQNVLAGGTN